MEIKNKTVVDKIKRNNTYFKEVKMKDFTEIDSKIRMAYSEFNFRPFVYEEIEEFIKTRTDYMNNPNNDTPSIAADGRDHNAAMQANILTLLEGKEDMIETKPGHKQLYNSNKTMFILIGSFQELRDKKQKEKIDSFSKKIGFNTQHNETICDTSDIFYENLTLEDIIDFGMQEELAGRITSVINFHKLDKNNMLNLLCIKAKEIGQEMNCSIVLSEVAKKELLELSYGNMGVRYPMNIIRTLAENAIMDVYFDRNFEITNCKIIIDSITSAHVVNELSYSA